MIGESPTFLFFLSLFILIIYKADNSNYDYNIKLILLAGIVIGSIALSRQFCFLLFIPLIVLLISKNSKQNYLIFWLTSSFIGALLSSWFYVGLYRKYGSFTAFNLESKGLSFSNQNLSFYIPNLSQLSTYLQNQLDLI